MSRDVSKKALKQTFDTVSGGYDGEALRFFPKSAELLVKNLNLTGDERVLDIATGTGHVALALARALPRGHVTAIDFSRPMLDQAQAKAASQGVSNIEFLEMDMESLESLTERFDAAVSGFGIFFSGDMVAQMKRMGQTVKPGGLLAVSTFAKDYMQPMNDLMYDRLSAYGIDKPPQSAKNVATEVACRQLFEKAGIDDIRVIKDNVGYFLKSADEWWNIVWNAGSRLVLSKLSDADIKRFKHDHLREVEALQTPEGIWLDVGVLYTLGKARLHCI